MDIINNNNLNGRCVFGVWKCCNLYSYIPLILEEKGSTSNSIKKIVMASFYVYMMTEFAFMDLNIVFVNNDSYEDEFDSHYGNIISSNISFMRNAIYDYSDELWEELNSGPIASSEMQYDNTDNDLSSPKVIT